MVILKSEAEQTKNICMSDCQIIKTVDSHVKLLPLKEWFTDKSFTPLFLYTSLPTELIVLFFFVLLFLKYCQKNKNKNTLNSLKSLMPQDEIILKMLQHQRGLEIKI